MDVRKNQNRTMKTMRLSQAFCLAAGTVILVIACQFFATPETAKAAAESSMEEYKVVESISSPNLETRLNELARQGWKVRTGAGDYVVILAR